MARYSYRVIIAASTVMLALGPGAGAVGSPNANEMLTTSTTEETQAPREDQDEADEDERADSIGVGPGTSSFTGWAVEDSQRTSVGSNAAGSSPAAPESQADERSGAPCVRVYLAQAIDPALGCGQPDETPAPVLTNAAVLQAFREVPLPEAVLTIQPPDGETLVNFDTNFYTAAESFTTTIVLLGYNVEMNIHAAEFTWTFGDGTVTTTTTPGAPYPDLDVTHAYSQPGDVTTQVVITWAADFRVDGGEWQTVDGTVDLTSAAVPLTIREATPVLVD